MSKIEKNCFLSGKLDLNWHELTSEILRLLVNTLAADGKYPVLNRYNLTIPIQMELS